MEFPAFPFFVINEAAKEENNQCHQGYGTQNRSTNDRRGGFTCNSKKCMAQNIPWFQYSVHVYRGIKQSELSVTSALISQSASQSVDR